MIDTSEESKSKSAKAIKEMGGDDNLYGKQDNPRSVSAAQNLEGSHAG